MTYTIVQVGLTDSQLHDLSRGVKIHLSREHFHGDKALPLTKSQATSIATATRGINMKMSGPQCKWLMEHHSGGGLLQDIMKAAAPLARKGIDYGLDYAQSKIPTDRLGSYRGIGDAAVGLGRAGGDKLLDMLQEKLGGSVGRMAIDKKMGRGWFDEYLLPGLETAAKIALPIIRGGGSRAHYKMAMDQKMGCGWFDQYLLPGLETAAKIAVPLITGRGIGMGMKYKGAGWFDEYLLPSLETAAKIAVPLITGHGMFDDVGSLFRGSAETPYKFLGGGFEPMTKKKSSYGRGLQL